MFPETEMKLGNSKGLVVQRRRDSEKKKDELFSFQGWNSYNREKEAGNYLECVRTVGGGEMQDFKKC